MEILNTEQYEKEENVEYCREFNENGQMTKEIRYKNGILNQESNWTYDCNGNKLSSYRVQYSTGGSVIDSTKVNWTYDCNGNKLSWQYTFTTPDSTYYEERNWTYDSNGNKLSRTSCSYDADGNLYITSKENWTYNANGKLIHWTSSIYDKDGNVKICSESDFTYNNNKITETLVKYDSNCNKLIDIYKRYDADGCVEYSCSQYWYYDSNNNLITHRANRHTAGGSIEDYSFKKEWTYDADGNKLSNTYISYSPEGEVYYSFKYNWTYDNNGNMLSQFLTEYNADESIRYSKEYYWTYDTHGNKKTESYKEYDSNCVLVDEWDKNCNNIVADSSIINYVKAKIAILDGLNINGYKEKFREFYNNLAFNQQQIAVLDKFNVGEYETKFTEFYNDLALNKQQTDILISTVKKAVNENVFSEIESMLNDGELQSIIANISAYGAEAGIDSQDVKEFVGDHEVANVVLSYLS